LFNNEPSKSMNPRRHFFYFKTLHQTPINNFCTWVPFLRLIHLIACQNKVTCSKNLTLVRRGRRVLLRQGRKEGYNLFCGLNLADWSSTRYRWLVPFLFITDVLETEALACSRTCLIASSFEHGSLKFIGLRGCIQKFPDRVDNEINNKNKHSLRSNTKGYGGKTH
jgi:hypothetical protein